MHIEGELFEPITIANMEVKNRIVMSSISLSTWTVERVKQFYIERSQGGVGLIICNLATITREMPRINQMGIEDDSRLPMLKDFVNAIHEGGAKIAAQLAARPVWKSGHEQAVEILGPSSVPCSHRKDAPSPRPLSKEDIVYIISEIGNAAKRAKDAGFDAVELHAFGGSCLLSQFLSPVINKRTDQYGGTLENRLRFMLEVIDRIRSQVGYHYPILCRISGDEFLEGGNTEETMGEVARILEGCGVDAINVTTGFYLLSKVPFMQMSVPRGNWIYLAQKIKKVVSIPVIGGTRINDPFVAEKAVSSGKMDMVYLCRALIADPQFPNKAMQGRFDEIRQCIACCHCLDSTMEGRGVECSINPRAGIELNFPITTNVGKSKKIVVVGGGPCGMQAAITAEEQGHQVTLYESNTQLGGALLLAALPPYKEEISNFIKHMIGRIEKSSIIAKLGQKGTISMILDCNPDLVVFATGADNYIPNIKGIKNPNVIFFQKALTDVASVGNRVIIIGGGMVGCEVADLLAIKGKTVTVLEKTKRFGADAGRTGRWVLLQRLRNRSVRLDASVEVIEISQDRVITKEDNKEGFINGDTVVIATGFIPTIGLKKEKIGDKVPFVFAGNCREPGHIRQAIKDGFLAIQQL